MSTIEVKVPDIGDFSDVPVIGIMVAAGDEVHEEDPLIELESDKATMEVPSPATGKIKEIKVAEGDKVFRRFADPDAGGWRGQCAGGRAQPGRSPGT